jgi:probable selenium-dependent hydroxylase accessory protein YqeC
MRMMLADALDARSERVIALVGGGGKTTIMVRLAMGLAELGRRVIVTTTTRIFAPSPGQVEQTVVCGDPERLVAQVREGLADCRLVAAGSRIDEDGKLRAIPEELVAELAKVADVVIVEADGAAGKPLKAPAPYEPVIPRSTTLVLAVVGIDAIGLVLDTVHVHRPERVAAVCGLAMGGRITPEVVAGVIRHPEGITRGAPADARIVPVLNKVEDPRQLADARQVARLLIEAGFPRVVLARARCPDPVVEVIVPRKEPRHG